MKIDDSIKDETLRDLRFFKVILSSIADGVFTVDESRVITSFNRAAERITGIPATKAIGRKCYEILHSDICETGCLLEKTLNTGVEAIDVPVRIIKSSNETIPISVSTSVLRDDNDNILGAVETFRDLSPLEHLRKELTRKYTFEDIISKSPIMHKIFAILPDVAESESTVLIQGPSGSGKELLARAVHNLSPRRDKPYVVINCGTLPPQLFESEIFGYNKGAFTDAKRDKPGKLAAANNGTVFFDEIGELPLSTQVKLLRLLQNREYEPLGSTKTISCNIRIVAATNKDLRELISQGRFRDDLYFRLAVVKFDLPPLKDRREDIPYLTDHFISRFNARRGKNILSVSPEVMNILMRHNFSGNIRELENIIEYAFAVCHGRIIEVEHLPVELTTAEDNKHNQSSKKSIYPQGERKVILDALSRNKGHMTHTAEELGIHRTTLWRKIKQFGIKRKEYI